MTERQTNRIGNAIKEIYPLDGPLLGDYDRGWRDCFFEIESVLVELFAELNPKFDRQLWLDFVANKCGPNGGKVK